LEHNGGTVEMKEAPTLYLIFEKMKKLLAILLLLFSLVSAQDLLQKVAVIGFDFSGISQLESTTLTNRFRAVASNVSVIHLM